MWIKDEKICAIGVRIKNRVTLHGLALNVCNDFSLFNKIIPCGISDFGVTSINKASTCPVDMTSVIEKLIEQFEDKFKIHLIDHTRPYLKND